jgi:ubiquinone/menaquinone biosynthesis C-methylase UbiE
MTLLHCLRLAKKAVVEVLSTQNNQKGEPTMPEEPFYVADPETLAEMARLLDQDLLVTRRVSGLLPAACAPDALQAVLDVGCGPGGWVREVATAFPHIQVTGIDRSELVIAYAAARARTDGLANAHFTQMDFQTLPYPDESFDLVNARQVQWFIPNAVRASVVREWYRVLRPGGVLRCIEMEPPMSNSLAYETLMGRFLQALDKADRTITRGGRMMGITLLLQPLLQQLGCQQIQEQATVYNFSANAPDYQLSVSDGLRFLQSVSPFLLTMQVIQKETLTTLLEQMQRETASPEFLGSIFFVSTWGRKPPAGKRPSA